ncbi:hypothetical protein B484DRAFT_458614 [Ochromonadaceae sp. CCMP2298]|nr:hypothetical protein B484DRAFT_458614 [Ochromonadaceae sp. CCMP2298]
MTLRAVERWLMTVNKQVGRGSEFRSAFRLMTASLQGGAGGGAGADEGVNFEDEAAATAATASAVERPAQVLPPLGWLSLADFQAVYRDEVAAGKVWGVASDLAACGYPLPPSDDCFLCRYDRAYVANAAVLAVRDTGGRSATCLPNTQQPSDHLPLMIIIDVGAAE